MPTFNLIRNSRVFFTTNVAVGTGVVNNTGFTTANSQELSVLDGFTFTQGTNADVITLSEAGYTPTRGQRSFNTSLNPVDFSFSTYMRPFISGTVNADESALWNALLGDSAATAATATLTGATTVTGATATGIMTVTGTGMAVLTAGQTLTLKGATGANASAFNSQVRVVSSSATTLVLQYLTMPAPAVFTTAAIGVVPATATLWAASWNANAAVAADTLVGNTSYAEVSSARSNVNQLLPFGMVVTVDGITYAIDNCAMDQASIDFGLDGIAMIAWTGKGTALRQLGTGSTNLTYSAVTNPVLGGATVSGTAMAGTIAGKSSVATTRFITTKLSTIALDAQIGGGGTTYNLALTGGNLTIANNINYLTPANLGVLNQPIGYYTGTRAISGSVNAYLRTGTNNSGDLLNTILASSLAGATEQRYRMTLAIGGSASPTRVEALITGASLQIPTVDAQAVLSTAINFTAQGTDSVVGTAGAAFDLENTNDIRVRYFSN